MCIWSILCLRNSVGKAGYGGKPKPNLASTVAGVGVLLIRIHQLYRLYNDIMANETRSDMQLKASGPNPVQNAWECMVLA